MVKYNQLIYISLTTIIYSKVIDTNILQIIFLHRNVFLSILPLSMMMIWQCSKYSRYTIKNTASRRLIIKLILRDNVLYVWIKKKMTKLYEHFCRRALKLGDIKYIYLVNIVLCGKTNTVMLFLLNACSFMLLMLISRDGFIFHIRA